MLNDQKEQQKPQPFSYDTVTKSWRILLVFMLTFIPLNLLLPCGCVLHDYDPRSYLLLMVAGAWIYNLICCLREKKLTDFWQSILTGVIFLFVVFFTTPL